MTDIEFSNPLVWKDHVQRTEKRVKSNFRAHSVSKSCKLLVTQLKRMNAVDCLVTSNIPQNTVGFAPTKLYANSNDVGVSVFFKLKGVAKVIQVDKYDDSNSNLHALAKSVEAIRNLERWGGVQVMDGVFSGFSALPSPEQATIFTPITYYFDGFNSKHSARPQYLDYCKKMHPDNGGNEIEFKEMKRQYEQLK